MKPFRLTATVELTSRLEGFVVPGALGPEVIDNKQRDPRS